MGALIPFTQVLDRRRRALVIARRSDWSAERYALLALAPIGAGPEHQEAWDRYFRGVENYFETGRPPAAVGA